MLDTTTTASSNDQRVASEMAAEASRIDRKLARRIIIDLIIFIALGIPVIICEFGIEPFRRGFFCDDETIRYPFRGNTVTPVTLGLLVGLVPVLFFIAIEFLRFYRRGQMSESQVIFGWKTPTWLLECIGQIWYFACGSLLTFDATEIGKYTIGRLRPHFYAVCQPRLLDGSTCADVQNQHRYIEEYMCVASGYAVEDVRQGRLSFPSGHSSLSFFAMVYLAIYIQYKLTWRGSKLTRHMLQFLLIMLAWFTALTRIMDNWHHWSDVLAGSLIGVLGALITARYIARNFRTSWHKMESLRIGISRQDTSATLNEMISSTPPPYTLNTGNSFSNEEYCTKV